MQMAVMIGVTTRKPTTVGAMDSASGGDSSYGAREHLEPDPLDDQLDGDHHRGREQR